MNVKKVLMVLISLALVCSFAGAVSAADNQDVNYTYDSENAGYSTTDGGQSTVLLDLTTVKPGFTLSIPDTIELIKQDDGSYGGEAQIQLKDIVIDYENIFKSLNVDVTSDTNEDKDPWTLDLVGGAGENIPYSMTATDYKNNVKSIAGYSGEANGQLTPVMLEGILVVTGEDLENTVIENTDFITNLKFQVTSGFVAAGGEFRDTLTFIVNVE